MLSMETTLMPTNTYIYENIYNLLIRLAKCSTVFFLFRNIMKLLLTNSKFNKLFYTVKVNWKYKQKVFLNWKWKPIHIIIMKMKLRINYMNKKSI